MAFITKVQRLVHAQLVFLFFHEYDALNMIL